MKPRKEFEKLAKVTNVLEWHVTGYLFDRSEFALSRTSDSVLFTNKEDESRELTYIVTFQFFGMLTLCSVFIDWNGESSFPHNYLDVTNDGGSAYCNPEDDYFRTEGMKLALKRACGIGEGSFVPQCGFELKKLYSAFRAYLKNNPIHEAYLSK